MRSSSGGSNFHLSALHLSAPIFLPRLSAGHFSAAFTSTLLKVWNSPPLATKSKQRLQPARNTAASPRLFRHAFLRRQQLSSFCPHLPAPSFCRPFFWPPALPHFAKCGIGLGLPPALATKSKQGLQPARKHSHKPLIVSACACPSAATFIFLPCLAPGPILCRLTP